MAFRGAVRGLDLGDGGRSTGDLAAALTALSNLGFVNVVPQPVRFLIRAGVLNVGTRS